MNKGMTVLLCAVVGLAVGAIAGVTSGLLRNQEWDLASRMVSGVASGIGAGAAILVVLVRSKRRLKIGN